VERSRQVTTVLTENHEMLESFSVINIELTTLARNLKAAENERERQKRVRKTFKSFMRALYDCDVTYRRHWKLMHLWQLPV
jgi:hypothetical protein